MPILFAAQPSENSSIKSFWVYSGKYNINELPKSFDIWRFLNKVNQNSQDSAEIGYQLRNGIDSSQAFHIYFMMLLGLFSV